MVVDPLGVLATAIGSDPRCKDFRMNRIVRDLDRFHHDFGPRDLLDLTHPATSTEFFVAWTNEGPGRLSILRGPGRNVAMEYAARAASTWTEAYRRYHDEFMNARAYGFNTRGSIDSDLESPFYGVWAAEVSSLHTPGWDDQGEFRSDKQHALCVGIYASVLVDEVVASLGETIASLDARVDVGLPQALQDERDECGRWQDRAEGARRAGGLVTVRPEAGRVANLLDERRLHAMFPRDHRGRLSARQRVLLQPVSSGSDRDRRPWIVAAGPARAGENEITVDVEPLIAANQLERFDLAPWCWQKQAGLLEDPQTWGYSGEWANAVELLVCGRVKEGLEAAGLQLDEAVARMARGSVIGLLQPHPTWAKVTRDRLSRLAPWLLLGPGLSYAKSLLRSKADGLRLFTLPGQRQARKASIVLVPRSKPSLEIRWTGTNARLPLVIWQRPPIPGVWKPVKRD